MAFRIKLNESVADAIRRLAREQTSEALTNLREPERRGIVESVHDCRKRCKKARGLIRLVRPAAEDQYQSINTGYRDAARMLSVYRDSHALLETFDDAVAAEPHGLPPGGLGTVRAELARRRDAATAAVEGDVAPIGEVIARLELMADSIDDWTVDGDGWDAVEGGWAKTYGRGRVALEAVLVDPAAEGFHELRKRAKYTGYHLHLVREADIPGGRALQRAFERLSDGLGDAHDLAVLGEQLAETPSAFGHDETVASARDFLDRRQLELERRSVRLARQLYREEPEDFACRIGAHWRLWHNHGPADRVGEIAALYEPDDNLPQLTVSELQTLARIHDLPGRSRLRRNDLVATLRAHGVNGADA